MIRKLRRKIILGNVGLVAALLSVVFLIVCVTNWQHNSREVLSAMNLALHEKVGEPAQGDDRVEVLPKPEDAQDPGKGDGPAQKDRKPILLATFVVELDAAGQVSSLTANYMEVTQEEAQSAVEAALEKGGRDGILWGRSLRYLVAETGGVRSIVFAELSGQLTGYAKLVLSLFAGFALALVGLWAISVWLARQAVRPVERAWQSQRQFVADASHELKTPLTVILANAGILAQQPEATVGSQLQWVENTREEARRMQKLVEDMLFLARSDDGGFSLQPQVLSFSDLVWGVELPFEAVAYEQGVELDCDIPEDMWVSGDELQLQRLVGILLDNACKYAGEGGSVRVTLTRQRDKACLAVANTGPVIPQEKLERLFERFYRADESRARSRGGYGLGLSIAQTIVKAHGGSIRAESSESRGTVFTVLLDLCQEKK